MSTATFQPWLFDDYSAWKKALSDPRWTYDQPASRFMAIYSEYRSGVIQAPPPSKSVFNQGAQPVMQSVPVAPTVASQPQAAAPSSPAAGQILSQNEIDNLLSMLSK